MYRAEAGPDQLGKALKWSMIAHGAVALVVVLKSLVFPGPQLLVAPALRVDVVGLPDLLKKDLAKVSKAQPNEALKEQLEEAAKQAKAVKPIDIPEPAAAPDEMVLNPKKVKKEPVEKKEEVKREKKLQSALARIRALERLKDKDEPVETEEAVIIKGNQVSKGSSLSGDAKEKAEAGYYDLVREKLMESWALPPWLARKNLAARVMITIDSAGNISSTKFVSASGNEQFDDAIRATLKESQPLPKPPAKIADTVASEGVVIGFPL